MTPEVRARNYMEWYEYRSHLPIENFTGDSFEHSFALKERAIENLIREIFRAEEDARHKGFVEGKAEGIKIGRSLVSAEKIRNILEDIEK